MSNSSFAVFCVIDSIILAVLIAVIIGVSTAIHMRKVNKSVTNEFKDKLGKTSNTTKYHEIAAENEKLRQERETELNELNKLVAETEEKALQARNAIAAEDIKPDNAAVVVATGKNTEKYTFDPQYKLEYFNGDSTRAYTESDKAFMEKFNQLTKDGVSFNEM